MALHQVISTKRFGDMTVVFESQHSSGRIHTIQVVNIGAPTGSLFLCLRNGFIQCEPTTHALALRSAFETIVSYTAFTETH